MYEYRCEERRKAVKVRDLHSSDTRHWVVRGTGTPKDRDEVNRRDVCEWVWEQGIQVKFLCFFEAVHELFMNVQMFFKFHGNIQIFLIIFELVLEVFMNCSNFLNCSWTLQKGRPSAGAVRSTFFLRRQPQNFFSDFKNTVVKGTLTILGGKNN